jgi:SAM-dependent methyltransferase
MPILPDEHPQHEYLDWVLKSRLKFLERWCWISPGTEVLDVGAENLLSREFARKCNLILQNTQGNLDFAGWEIRHSHRFDDVLCLEVLEHLANPLHFLLLLRNIMKPAGRLWLTTPKASWHWLWNRDHFMEYDRRRLTALLGAAGFKIESFALTKSGWPLGTFWRGARPCIRAIFRWSYCVKAVAMAQTNIRQEWS